MKKAFKNNILITVCKYLFLFFSFKWQFVVFCTFKNIRICDVRLGAGTGTGRRVDNILKWTVNYYIGYRLSSCLTPNVLCPRIDGCSSTSAGKKCCPLGGSGKFLLFVKTLSDGRNKCRVCPALPVTCMVLENFAPSYAACMYPSCGNSSEIFYSHCGKIRHSSESNVTLKFFLFHPSLPL